MMGACVRVLEVYIRYHIVGRNKVVSLVNRSGSAEINVIQTGRRFNFIHIRNNEIKVAPELLGERHIRAYAMRIVLEGT